MKAKKSDCEGCRNDFYNGKNDLGVGECWSFKDAEIVTLYQIGTWVPQDRASNFTKVKRPSCYHQTGSVFMKELPKHLRYSQAQPTPSAQE
jgi:hypothetical protein